MGANASERAQRQAVLNSTMWEFAGWRLAVDCGTRECGGERAYLIAELASLYGRQIKVGAVIRRLRCRECGRAPKTCAIETGPEIAQRGRMRRLALTG